MQVRILPGALEKNDESLTLMGVPFIDFINLPLFTQANNGESQLVLRGHPTRVGSQVIAEQMLKAIANLR